MVIIVKRTKKATMIGAGKIKMTADIVSVLPEVTTFQVTLKRPKYGVSFHSSVRVSSVSGMTEIAAVPDGVS